MRTITCRESAREAAEFWSCVLEKHKRHEKSSRLLIEHNVYATRIRTPILPIPMAARGKLCLKRHHRCISRYQTAKLHANATMLIRQIYTALPTSRFAPRVAGLLSTCLPRPASGKLSLEFPEASRLGDPSRLSFERWLSGVGGEYSMIGLFAPAFISDSSDGLLVCVQFPNKPFLVNGLE